MEVDILAVRGDILPVVLMMIEYEYICKQHQKHMEKTIHQGRNVKRFREMLGIKQEAMAFDLGDDWSQRKISMLEQKEV